MNFSKVEKELNIILPDSYKKIMSSYPFKGEMYVFSKDDLLDKEELLIEVNLYCRENGIQGKSLPKDSFVISKNQNDSFMFILLNDEKIYYVSRDVKFNPKNLKRYLIYNSFDEFVEAQKVLFEIEKLKT